MKNIAFIVNPISGTKVKNRVAKLIRELLDPKQFSPTVVMTEYAGHATQLAQQFATQEYYAVVAVGGDGTINEVASGLAGTSTALGIVPNGSSNGFARHLDISTRMNRAIEMLNNSEVIYVDYGMVNEQPFFISCDSTIPAQTADTVNYAQLVHIANAGQWEHEGVLTPKPSVQDGWLDVALVHETGVEMLRTKELTLMLESEGPVHIDGTPTQMGKELHVRIVEDGLRVLVKKRF